MQYYYTTVALKVVAIDSTTHDNYGLVDQDHYAVLHIIMYECDNGYVEIPESQNN